MAVDLIKMSHNELYVSCLIRMRLGLDKNASIEMSRVWNLLTLDREKNSEKETFRHVIFNEVVL